MLVESVNTKVLAYAPVSSASSAPIDCLKSIVVVLLLTGSVKRLSASGVRSAHLFNSNGSRSGSFAFGSAGSNSVTPPAVTLVITSPSAIVPPELPANAFALARNELASGDPGEDHGFLLMISPSAAHRENPKTVHVTDIVPTVLFAAGLPVGRDMDGRVVTDAFSEEMLRRSSLSAIQTYEAERFVVRRQGVQP